MLSIPPRKKGYRFMEENRRRLRAVLTSVLILAALIVSAVLYTVIDARLHRQRDNDSPEAYGLDSLEAVLTPPMEIEIWQKNDMLSAEPDPQFRMDVWEPKARYYTRIPLELKPGVSVCTTCDPFTMPSPHMYSLIASVFYDLGTVRCTWDIPAKDAVTLKASSDYVPDIYASDLKVDNTDVTRSPDGVIVGNRSFSFSISDEIKNNLFARFDNAYHSDFAEMALRKVEEQAGVDLDDYYTLEKLKDTYPDAPFALQNLERVVLTTHLTVEAMHPTKPNTPVARAVLEIKSFSWWLNSTNTPSSRFCPTNNRTRF